MDIIFLTTNSLVRASDIVAHGGWMEVQSCDGPGSREGYLRQQGVGLSHRKQEGRSRLSIGLNGVSVLFLPILEAASLVAVC